MGIKEKKLGGVKTVRAGVPKELSLEQKRAVGQSIIEGRYTAAEAGKMYGVSPQAVGWWKRLAEREEAAEKSEGDIMVTETPDIIEDLALDTEDVMLHTQMHGKGNIEITLAEGLYSSTFEAIDIRITTNFNLGTCVIHFNLPEDE
jgi:transposase-like protein